MDEGLNRGILTIEPQLLRGIFYFCGLETDVRVSKGAAQSRLVHNTLVSNTLAGLDVYDAASHTEMINSIVWDSGATISHTAGMSITISYSDIGVAGLALARAI